MLEAIEHRSRRIAYHVHAKTRPRDRRSNSKRLVMMAEIHLPVKRSSNRFPVPGALLFHPNPTVCKAVPRRVTAITGVSNGKQDTVVLTDIYRYRQNRRSTNKQSVRRVRMPRCSPWISMSNSECGRRPFAQAVASRRIHDGVRP